MMTRRAFVKGALLGALATAAFPAAAAPQLTLAQELALLPSLDGYRVAPYLAAVARLQSLEFNGAVAELRAAAAQGLGLPLILLCRLLFRARGPFIGAPLTLGGSDPDDWPLCPLVMQDDFPFLITTGFDLDGRPESAEQYLNHCIEVGSWVTPKLYRTQFGGPGAALARLLHDPRWKRRLDDRELEFLGRQIGAANADWALKNNRNGWARYGGTPWPEWGHPARRSITAPQPPTNYRGPSGYPLWRRWNRPVWGTQFYSYWPSPTYWPSAQSLEDKACPDPF
jgi:hypothetical protein